MNLSDFKQKQIAEETARVKDLIREEEEIVSFFSEEELDELREEVLFEDWQEDIFFEGTLDCEPQLIDENCFEEFTFYPNKLGDKMDLEFEIDLEENNVSYLFLGKMRDALFAEDYEVEEKDDRRAKVTFKRAGGQISKKKVCGPGMKLKGNRCVPQSGTEKAGERRKGIKLKRAKRAMGAGAKKKAAIKAKITKKRVAGRNRSYAGT